MKKILLLSLALSLNAFAAPNSIVAIVNDDLVTYDSIDVKSNLKAERLAAVNRQIDIILQMDKVKSLGIKPKSDAINSMLKRVAMQNYFTLAQLQKRPEFIKIAADISKKLSLNGLRQYINNKAGITLGKAEVDKVLNSNPAIAEDIVTQIRIAQIIISSTDKADSLVQSQDELIKAFLIDLSAQIQQGKSFSSLAKLHSQDKSYANGGESGWLIQSRLPKDFIQTLSSLKVEELSKPFKVDNAWRLVKIIEKRTIDNHLANIKAALMRQKENAYFSNWVKKLRESAYIEIFDHKL